MNVSWLFDADFVEAFSASYEHYNAGMNAAAAPSLKLVLWRPNTPSGYDGYGELIYEPYWQGGGNPVHDQWLTENITGESGAWWTTGVFGQPGSAGGPPVRTLSEWLGLFSTGDTGYDASTTIVTQIYMGVGSYNPGVDSFFDNLSINVPDFSETYDFETPAASVPEGGATIFLFALAGGLLVGGRRLINPR